MHGVGRGHTLGKSFGLLARGLSCADPLVRVSYGKFEQAGRWRVGMNCGTGEFRCRMARLQSESHNTES